MHSGQAEQSSMILSLLRSPFRRRAFTRRTQKPLSSLWKVTRSITPEISSVAGRRSGIAAVMCGDSILPRMDGNGDDLQKADSAGIWLLGRGLGRSRLIRGIAGSWGQSGGYPI
jgi:hypothetical protein